MQNDRKRKEQGSKEPKRNIAATARTAERREERERQRRNQRFLFIGVTVGLFLLLIVLPLLLANQPSEAPIPETALTRYEGLTASRTTEGYLRLGDPEVPVQVAEYSSFGCDSCKAFSDAILDPILERVRANDIVLIYVPLWQTSGVLANTQGAARAAVCAGEQNKFWQMHDAFYQWQTMYGNQAYTNSRILSGVSALGMDRGVYDSCIGSGRPNDVLYRAQQQANALINFVEPPGITINGVVPVDADGNAYTQVEDILRSIDAVVAATVRRPSPAAIITEETPEATESVETPEAESTLLAEDTATPETTEDAVISDVDVTPEATESASE